MSTVRTSPGRSGPAAVVTYPPKSVHIPRAAAVERAPQGRLKKRLKSQMGGPVGRSEDGLGEALRD